MTVLKKTSVLFILWAILLALVPFSAYAASASDIMPLWDSVGDVTTSIDFYDNVGEVSASVTRGSAATSLAGVLTIYENQDGEWVYLDSTSKTTTRNTLAMSYDFYGISGYEYKMELIVTAYSGTTVIEEITDTKYATCP